MSDLISRNELLEELRFKRVAVYGRGSMKDIDKVIKSVETAPAVDAEPVRHGYWIFFRSIAGDEYTFECSVCNEWADRIHNYCPHCGAKMDVEVKE